METPYVSGGRLSKAASQMSTPLHRIVDQLLAELSAELEPEGRDHIIELSYIVSSALGLAAETFCKDEIDTIFETLVGMRAGLWRSQAVRIEPGKRRCDVKAVGTQRIDVHGEAGGHPRTAQASLELLGVGIQE